MKEKDLKKIHEANEGATFVALLPTGRHQHLDGHYHIDLSRKPRKGRVYVPCKILELRTTKRWRSTVIDGVRALSIEDTGKLQRYAEVLGFVGFDKEGQEVYVRFPVLARNISPWTKTLAERLESFRKTSQHLMKLDTQADNIQALREAVEARAGRKRRTDKHEEVAQRYFGDNNVVVEACPVLLAAYVGVKSFKDVPQIPESMEWPSKDFLHNGE